MFPARSRKASKRVVKLARRESCYSAIPRHPEKVKITKKKKEKRLIDFKPGLFPTPVGNSCVWNSRRGEGMVRNAASIDLFLLLLLPFLLAWPLVASVDGAHEKDSSAGSLFWSTAKDEADLLRSSQENSAESVADDHSDSDGGFSSLEGMLQWAIGN